MRICILTLLFPVLAACGLETDESTSSAIERGSIDETDPVGSCDLGDGVIACGGQGSGECWCDEACVDLGNCCADAADVCELEMPQSDDACGGLLGLACAEDEFCLYAPEHFCGAADHTGICTPIPEVCAADYAPVCGCDGQTYSNACLAAAAGTSVAFEGQCLPTPGEFCGGFAGIECPEGLTCIDDPTDSCDPQSGGADCGGVCVREQACAPVTCELFCEYGFVTNQNGCEVCECAQPPEEPEEPVEPEEPELEACRVAGCSGELCVGPDGPDASICIYEPWYACLELTSCGNYGDDGACGWEPTEAYLDCLAKHGA